MERMEDQRYTRLDGKDDPLGILTFRGSGENWKYSRLVGMDGRLEILMVWWQGCKIGNTQGWMEGFEIRNTQGQLEWMEDQKY